jgi:hypothetical protein
MVLSLQWHEGTFEERSLSQVPFTGNQSALALRLFIMGAKFCQEWKPDTR